ncbi:MAG: hypothetical protein DCC55_33045 [Chloroflexi bacterium]|nr:MAG: hypothetical protein DCC55_33045 [Chloroflexota bacterium]
MTGIKAANLAIRFLLELCALAALGYWGFQAGQGTLAKIALGIGAPLVAALVWGVFVSPRAAVPVRLPVRLLLELIIFGAAVAGLAVAGQRTLAWALALVVVINEILLYVWGQ